MTRKDWARYRARVDIFDVPEFSLSESSRQRQFLILSQSPESHLISNNIDMSNVRESDADSLYI
jgi:hypothetical protein